MSADSYVKIAVLENEVEAQLLRAVLSERGLPHLIRSFHDSAYDGLFQFQWGWGEVRAQPPDKGEILALLQSIREQHPISAPPTAADGP